MCHLCEATPETRRQTADAAIWRNQRVDHWGVTCRFRCLGLSVSSVRSWVPVSNGAPRLDGHHGSGRGGGRRWQLLRYLLDKFPGRSKEEQCAHSWRRVVALHDIHPCDSRLDSLKLTTFTRTGDAAAKPRSPAECRGLVPVARHLTEDMLSNDEALESTVRFATCRFRKLLRMPIDRPHADILASHGSPHSPLLLTAHPSSKTSPGCTWCRSCARCSSRPSLY